MFEKNTMPVAEIEATDTLFGDLPLEYWAAINSNESPWNLFKEAKQHIDIGDTEKAIEVLKNVLSIPALESRQYLQAYYFLNALGVTSYGAPQIFGVVVEVGMPEGADLLAVYADHSARYYNYSGRAIIWEGTDGLLAKRIDDILLQSLDIVQQIGPWKDKRRAAPADKMARVNFLTSHGLHFGEAPQAVLFDDPLVQKLMYGLMEVRNLLITKTSGGLG